MTKARDTANFVSTGVPNSLITLDAAEIPNLDTAKITTGTLANARVADLPTSKITTGTFADARISASSVTQHASDYIAWQSVVTAATLTAVAGRGYPINTTSNACTVTLPASASVGDTIKFVDYARNWGTNALTLNPNSLNFQGNSSPNPIYNTNAQAVTITYVDATQGWIPSVDDDVSLETPQTYSFEVLVIGGGGSGAFTDTGFAGGGGGSGGISYHNAYPATATGVTFAVTVGAGGIVVPDDATMNGGPGGTYANSIAPEGGNSIFGSGGQTILTAFGGGGGSGYNGHYTIGGEGGSGGGSEGYGTEGTTGGAATQGTGGTTHYGNEGGSPGSGSTNYAASGGGGTDVSTGDRGRSSLGGPGTSAFSAWGVATTTGHNVGGTVYYASGGGGGCNTGDYTNRTTAINGGGGTGGDNTGSSGANAVGVGSGGGGRGKHNAGSGDGGSGSNGIVIVKRLTGDSTTTSGTVSTSGSYTYHVFTANGTYTS